VQLELRDYQSETLDAVQGAWARDLNRPAVVLPTGSGKTVIFAELVRILWKLGIKTVVLVHRDELVNQAEEKLFNAMPDAKIGVVKAERNEVDAEVLVASVQTLSRETRRDQLTGVGAIIVDEAHHAVAPSYRKIMEHYGCYPEDGAKGIPTVGFTATLARGDNKGLGNVWPEVVYERDIEWMCERGYLVWPRGIKVDIDGLDLTTVARSRGDYQDNDLGRALVSVGAGGHIAKAINEHVPGQPGVVFAPSVDSANAFAEDLNDAGIPAEVVVGTTPLEDRKAIYQRVYDGTTQVLVNCMVLTEGFDLPKLSWTVPRPTSNPVLYTQIVGRVLRPWPGKSEAIVLDMFGTAGKHRLVTLKDLSKYSPRDGETMKEAKERHQRELLEKGEVSGVQTAEEFDLFDRSKSAWLQTYAGLWFVPTRAKVIFLWPTGDGHFLIGRCDNRTTEGGEWFSRGQFRRIMARDADRLQLDYAMSWAEQAAREIDPSVSNREAAWRVNRAKPSPEQVKIANWQKIPYQGLSKAELSDKLSIHFASRLLDPGRRR
jgi:ATP-dependent helicase IRC3